MCSGKERGFSQQQRILEGLGDHLSSDSHTCDEIVGFKSGVLYTSILGTTVTMLGVL